MKRVFLMLCCLTLLASFSSVGYCEDDLMATDGYFNGHFMVEGVQSEKSSVEWAIVKAYFHGLCDALAAAGYREKFLTLYGRDATNNKMFETIYIYYKNNPTQRNRPVITVLLSGAK